MPLVNSEQNEKRCMRLSRGILAKSKTPKRVGAAKAKKEARKIWAKILRAAAHARSAGSARGPRQIYHPPCALASGQTGAQTKKNLAVLLSETIKLFSDEFARLALV